MIATDRFAVFVARVLAALATIALAVALLPPTAGAQGGPNDACPVEAPESTFSDRAEIPDAHRTNVDCAAHVDIVEGFPDGTYRPRLHVRRDQMASFIALTLDAYGASLPAGEPNTFADVGEGNVHADNINRLAAAGIVEGGPLTLPADEYGPALPTRRDQMASFLMRAAGFALRGDVDAFGHAIQIFGDVPPGNEHFEKVNAAAQHAIALGMGDGFKPGQATRRDQMASFAVRLLAFLEQARGPALEVTLDPAGCELGESRTATATLRIDGAPVEGEDVDFTTAGAATTPDEATAQTDADGEADFTFTVDAPGTLTATASWSSNGQEATATATVTCGAVAAWDVSLSWINEVDDSDPGNPAFRQGEEGASGDADLVVFEDTGGAQELGFRLDASDVTPPFCDGPGAHLHEGGVNENGPVVVFFATCAELQTGAGVVSGTLTDADFLGGVTIQDVVDDPNNFYVNVHSADFPAGAIRGQLPGGGQELIPGA